MSKILPPILSVIFLGTHSSYIQEIVEFEIKDCLHILYINLFAQIDFIFITGMIGIYQILFLWRI
jgi:hypothetical protein